MKTLGLRALFVSVTLGLATAGAAHAQLNDQLNDFWEDVNEHSNVTPPQAYMGQQGGYFTGGSLVYRAEQNTLQPFTATAPSVRAGCGGIDIFTGGFGFVDSEQLVASLRAMMSNAQGIAFNLALKTVCPQCEETLVEMQDWAQRINNMNIQSCEASQLALGAVWPRVNEIEKTICSMTGASSGRFADYVRSRNACGSDASDLNSTMPDAASRTPVNKNIAWEAIRNLGFFDPNNAAAVARAEFMMSMTGTLVIRQPAGTEEPTFIYERPRGSSDEILEVLLEGGEFQGLECDDANLCLNMTSQNIEIDRSAAFLTRTVDLLSGILSKIENRQPLTEEEIAFVNSTSLPVYKILSVANAYSDIGGQTDVAMLAEYISLDLASEFLSRVMDEAVSSRSEIEMAAAAEEYEQWRAAVHRVIDTVAERRRSFASRHNLDQGVIDQYRQLEQIMSYRLETRFAQQFANAAWVD